MLKHIHKYLYMYNIRINAYASKMLCSHKPLTHGMPRENSCRIITRHKAYYDIFLLSLNIISTYMYIYNTRMYT